MAIRYAIANGDWSDPATWNTGTLPLETDEVRANGKTVTINGAYTVATCSNRVESTPAVVAGGTFALANGAVLTCTATPGIIGGSSAGAVSCALGVGQTATVNAVVRGGAATSTYGILRSGSGTLIINGAVGGGTATTAHGVVNSGAGEINITGALTIGGTSGSALSTSGVGVAITITGAVSGGTGTVSVISNTGAATLTVIGAVTAGMGVGISTSAGPTTLTVIGALTASAMAPAVTSTVATAVVVVTGPFAAASNGMQALSAFAWRWHASAIDPCQLDVPTADLSAVRPLYTANTPDLFGYPLAADVRLDTVYGPLGEIIGRCAVPPPAAVGVGVPVENTVGTAVLTQADIAAVVGLLWAHG